MKNETWLFSVYPVFILQKKKTKMGITDHIFIFSFFVWGLEKKKRMLSYPFSIFYYEMEKRKTKGRYIHGPGRRSPMISKQESVCLESAGALPSTMQGAQKKVRCLIKRR